SNNPWFDVSPKQGRTPQDIVATFDPSGLPANQASYSSFLIKLGGVVQRAVGVFYIVLPGSLFHSDSLYYSASPPGGLIPIHAGTSRCDLAPPQAPPWPRILGGCTVRVNGAPIPIGSIAAIADSYCNGDCSVVFRPLYEPSYALQAQLPYDLDGPVVTV